MSTSTFMLRNVLKGFGDLHKAPMEQVSNKSIALAASAVGLSIFGLVDPPRFKKYIFRPIQKVFSTTATVVGFVGNVILDLGRSNKKKKEEWKEQLKGVVDYLETSGLSQEWGVDLPDFIMPLVVILNEVQYRHFPRTTLPAKVSPKSLREGSHFMKFATAVYGAEMIFAAELETDSVRGSPKEDVSVELMIARHCDVSPQDILVQAVEFGDSTEYLQHLLVVDHAHKAVVLAVRGTFSLTSAIVDLAAYTAEFSGGRAHSGMANMALAVLRKASEALKAKLDQVPEDYEMVVTGHSLGAGVACLITILLHSAQGKGSMGWLPPQIRCMAFAPPPVFYPLEAAPEAVQNTTAFVHNMDCVPALSIHALRRVVNVLNALNRPFQNLARPNPTELWNLLQHSESPFVHAVMECVEQPLKELEGAEPLLIPAQQFIWMKEENRGQDDIVSYDTKLLDVYYWSGRLLDIHSRMVSDHMAPQYELSFQTLLRQQAASGTLTGDGASQSTGA